MRSINCRGEGTITLKGWFIDCWNGFFGHVIWVIASISYSVSPDNPWGLTICDLPFTPKYEDLMACTINASKLDGLYRGKRLWCLDSLLYAIHGLSLSLCCIDWHGGCSFLSCNISPLPTWLIKHLCVDKQDAWMVFLSGSTMLVKHDDMTVVKWA